MPENLAATLLLIACPLAWAAFDVVRKGLAGIGRAMPVTFAITAVQLPVVLTWAVVEVVGSGGARIPPMAYWPPGLGALIVGVFGTLAFQQAVRLSPMSATVPLLSLTPAFSAVLGALLLDEVPSPRQWLGIVITVVGALLVNASPGEGLRPARLLRDLRAEPGSAFMIAAALLFSLAPLFDKQALRHVPLAVHAAIVIAGMFVALGGRLIATRRWGEMRAITVRYGLLMAGGATSLLAFVLQLAAVQVVWVGLLETAKRSVGATAALVLGVAFFGERATVLRVVAVALLASGVGLVVL